MTKTVRIEGMMCTHCESHVKNALEAIDGVTAAKASHTDGTAVIECSSDIADSAIRDAVESAGYKYIG